MDLDLIRARLSADPAHAPASAIAGPAQQLGDLADARLVAAAVLVPIVAGAQPGILLTKRTTSLTTHAGQVAFPGGRIDPGDASAEAAALREAREEIGLASGSVELRGRLPDLVTGTGFRITPVLGLLAGPPALRLNPAEVESAFVLPLATLLDPAAPQRRQAEFRGRAREFWVWPHADHYIWGATAAILVTLAQRLRDQSRAAA